MYRTFFNLQERPFDLTPNPRHLILTDVHREALSNLTYGIASRKGITVLIGEAGTGKTTVIRAALERQDEHCHAVHLHNPTLTRAEFVELLAVRFALTDEARRSKAALLVELEQLLIDRRARGEYTVLIIDEAQSVPLELLEEIRLLANIETAEDKLLSVVLAGQPELATRLQDSALRQLKQRVALRCELRPLTVMETFAYVAGRIRSAGGVGAQIFTKEAVRLLHDHSGGIPRTISVLADNALLSGFALNQKPIGSAIVRDVCRDFDMAARENATKPEEPAAAAPAAPSAVASKATAAAAPAPVAIEPARVLAFEKPLHGDEPPVANADVTPENGMFGTMYPKRRRFLFF